MCGIVGYVGEKRALPLLIEGLRRLEYRGYDSAGVAVVQNGRVEVIKTVGKLNNLEARLSGPLEGSLGIGHTRWATHGRPNDENAHPHTDCHARLAVIHNGIIENFLPLKQKLLNEGHVFDSETDTEVLAHLIESCYDGDLEEAVRQAVAQARGAYAIAVISRDEPDRIVAVRVTSPLVIGLGREENFLASDIPALIGHTRRVLFLDDGEMAVLTRDKVEIKRVDGTPVSKDVYEVTWDVDAAEKGGYAHFMLKEIHEQPRAFADTLTGRLEPDDSKPVLPELEPLSDVLKSVRHIHIAACGSAYHAGLVAKALIEKMVRIPVSVDVASEFRYRDPIIGPGDLLIVISQSGETADTLAALREGKRRGARVLAICNVVGSSITREADATIYTWAGPEIAVCSTKAYTTQLLVCYLLAAHLAVLRRTLPAEEMKAFLGGLRQLPQLAPEVLKQEEAVAQLARRVVSPAEDVFFIGRGLDYFAVLEGQLKLKEISYIHAEAYAAGELKHGTLALITRGVPVIAVATQPDLMDKSISNITEVRARDATVLAIGLEGDAELKPHADYLVTIPRSRPEFTPVLTALVLQLLSYHTAVARGTDVDKPRNLAKSVTVE